MPGPVYTLNGPVRCVALDGLSVIYHPPSGQTHFVASPVPQLGDALAAGPADAAALTARLATRFDLSGGVEAVAEHLTALDALGLVRAA